MTNSKPDPFDDRQEPTYAEGEPLLVNKGTMRAPNWVPGYTYLSYFGKALGSGAPVHWVRNPRGGKSNIAGTMLKRDKEQ